MKSSSKLLALMVAVTLGTAAAGTLTLPVSAGTNAGTAINNQASADFTDPSTNAAATTVKSNTVTTTVTAITGFNIVYQDGSADDTTASAPAASYDKSDVVPGGTVTTRYVVNNNSNIDGYVVNLASVTSTTDTATFNSSNVKYYADNGSGVATGPALTSVTLLNGASKAIVQVITIPAGAAATKTYSATPQGSAPASTDTTAYPTAPAVAFSAYLEATNTPNTNGNLEYTRATIFNPNLTPKPPADTDPKSAPITPPGVPGVGTTPPTNSNPSTNPTYNPPVNPTGTPTNNPGTVIVVNPTSGDQSAYPKSDTDTAADVVTFVSDIKNNSTTTPDQVIIKPDLSGLPSGASIKVLDKAGNVLTETAAGSGKYIIPYDPANPATLTPANGTAVYQLVVTYPDSDTSPLAIISIPVGIYSGVVPATTALTTSNFKIYPPNILFGDSPSTASAGYNNSGNGGTTISATPAVEERVIPGGATSVTSASQTDSSAVFPISIKNTGTYDEAYTLSAPNVVFKDISGNDLTAASVSFYDSTGTLLSGGVTPTITAGSTSNFYAVVNVPSAAAATTSGGGNQPDKTLTITATGNYSTDTLSDSTDFVSVGYNNSGITVVKKQSADGATLGSGAQSAAPKKALNYQIVASNTYNGPVKSFILKDNGGLKTSATNNAFQFTDFVSATVTLSAQFNALTSKTPYYSTDGGTTWVAATGTGPYTLGITAGTDLSTYGVQVYIDTDNTQTGTGKLPTAGDVVPASGTITLTINTTIK
ncbi:beta strand repeat-containing protein [Deinococcus sp.]|uniref:beta strand repeat-containing protein n=1 Tax=Deinococcus sp. TaxID=47478 RepID=UPI003CC63A35